MSKFHMNVRYRPAHLHDAMADSAVLSLPQKHQTDHNHSRYGDCNHQQANQCAAPKAEVLSKGAIGLLPSMWEVRRWREKRITGGHFLNFGQNFNSNCI